MDSLRHLFRHPGFRLGAREMSAAALGVAAWGLVTGVTMVKSGLPVPLALFMSLAVFAGSVQLVAVPLMMVGTPMWVTLATAFCVNLRFIIFSAQWRPFFIRFPRWQRVAMSYLCADLNYVMFMKRFTEPSADEGQTEYFFGGAVTCWLAWQVPSILGIVLADVIPTHWGLGFAGVLALLGLAYSLVSDKATALAAAVAACAAVAAFALPLRLYIVVAIAAAVCVGLLFDGGDDAARRRRARFRREAAPPPGRGVRRASTPA